MEDYNNLKAAFDRLKEEKAERNRLPSSSSNAPPRNLGAASSSRLDFNYRSRIEPSDRVSFAMAKNASTNQAQTMDEAQRYNTFRHYLNGFN
jgi:hypothetical protein